MSNTLKSLRVCIVIVLLCSLVGAQSTNSSNTVVPMLVQFSGVVTDGNGKPLTGMVGVTFSLYREQQGGAPLWIETQNVRPSATGQYWVMLGASTSQGLPANLFASGEARWLGVQVQGQAEQPRVMLLSVPYALKAGDAQTVGGLPATAFVLASPSASGGASSAAASPASGSGPNVGGSGTEDYIPLWTDNNGDLGNSILFQSGTGSTAKIGINEKSPLETLDVNGTELVRGLLEMATQNYANKNKGFDSQPFNLESSAFNSGTGTYTLNHFQWQAEPVGNDTTTPGATLNLLYGTDPNQPAETGLSLSSAGLFTFAPGQTFPGTGTITGVTAGSDLTGGGTSGNVTLNLDTTKVPLLGAANTFTANQTVNGTMTATTFAGNGSGLTDVTAANSNELGGLAPSAFAQLAAANTFTKKNTFNGSSTFNAPTTFQGGTNNAIYAVSSTNSSVPTVYALQNGTSGGSTGVYGQTADPSGTGVSGYNQASSGNSIGVYGGTFSSSGYGVAGDNGGSSGEPVGVYGQAFNCSGCGYGVYGSAGGAGVYGVTNASSGYGVAGVNGGSPDLPVGAGVYGLTNAATGYGVAGINQSLSGGTGVYGSAVFGGYGVYGSGPAYGTGVYGVYGSPSGSYVYGGIWGDTADGTAVWATAVNGSAGEFFNDSSSNPTLAAYNGAPSSDTAYALSAGGIGPSTGSCTIDIHGNLDCTGSKSAVVPVDGGSRKVALYAMEAPENWFEDFGSGQLSNGSARIDLDPTFAQTVNTDLDYHVFLTPNDECEGLYVTHKTATSFEVRELHKGKSNVTFDYRIIAKRKKYETIRLADLTEQYKKLAEQQARMRQLKPAAIPAAANSAGALGQKPGINPMEQKQARPIQSATPLRNSTK
jgi:hypothetical protein